MQTSSIASLAKQADPEDALLSRMQSKGKMDKGKAVAIAKSRGWVQQSGRHLELTSKGKKPRDNAAAHQAEEKSAMTPQEARIKMAAYVHYLGKREFAKCLDDLKTASYDGYSLHETNAARFFKLAKALESDKIGFAPAIKTAFADFPPQAQYKIARAMIKGLAEKIACSGNYKRKKKKAESEKQALGMGMIGRLAKNFSKKLGPIGPAPKTDTVGGLGGGPPAKPATPPAAPAAPAAPKPATTSGIPAGGTGVPPHLLGPSPKQITAPAQPTRSGGIPGWMLGTGGVGMPQSIRDQVQRPYYLQVLRQLLGLGGSNLTG